ncbi:MAG: ABC transporter ATP-binding protein [Candidatus Zixiibacteriota bacterium]
MLELTNVSKRFGDHVAVSKVSMTIQTSESIVVFGPSGAGKTTLMRLIAGFEEPDEGTITIDGALVASPSHMSPPHNRRIGMVFQDLALWPHLSVSNNVAFSLRSKRIKKTKRRNRVSELLERLKLTPHATKFPGQLSGGEQQRVALARAIIARPKLLLLDEPLGSIDRPLAEMLARYIRQLQTEYGFTLISVTHDRNEASLIGDRIIFFEAGEVCDDCSDHRMTEVSSFPDEAAGRTCRD